MGSTSRWCFGGQGALALRHGLTFLSRTRYATELGFEYRERGRG